LFIKNCTFRVFPPFRQRYFGQGGIDKTVTTKRNRYPFLNFLSRKFDEFRLLVIIAAELGEANDGKNLGKQARALSRQEEKACI